MDILKNVNLTDHEVRLFPSTNIKSGEAEIRATASLLAMVRAVSEFGREIISVSGGRSSTHGKIHCYTELPLDDGTLDKSKWPRPDGIMIYKRGKYEWKVLVEVKVGDYPLKVDQINEYLKLANKHNLNAVFTISNQAARQNGSPPIDYNKKIRKVKVCHLSWERLLSIARMLAVKKEVQDKDQQWMLDEWIRYVTDHRSQIMNPPDLGKNWSDILKAAGAKKLNTCATMMDDVVSHWIGFLRIAALRLSGKLGLDVKPRIIRKEKNDPSIRIERIKKTLLEHGTLLGEIMVPRTVNYIQLIMDTSKKDITYRLQVLPPTEGWQTTRVKWLLKQLKTSDTTLGDLLVQVKWNKPRITTWDYLNKIQEDMKPLYFTKEGIAVPKEAMPSLFILEWKRPFRQGRGRSGAMDLENVFKNLKEFYQNIVVLIKPYEALPKKLPQVQTEEDNSDVSNEELKS